MMKVKQIRSKNPQKVVEGFMKAIQGNGACNWKNGNEYIYYVGGILCKLKGDKTYYCEDKKWKEI